VAGPGVQFVDTFADFNHRRNDRWIAAAGLSMAVPPLYHFR